MSDYDDWVKLGKPDSMDTKSDITIKLWKTGLTKEQRELMHEDYNQVVVAFLSIGSIMGFIVGILLGYLCWGA